MGHLNRRCFLKYVGATCVVVGASALGLDYVLGPRPSLLNQRSTTIASQTTSTSKYNNPPVANFRYKPLYLYPTDEQTLQFTNLSWDLDNDPLQYTWLVDGQTVSRDKDYSSEPAVGTHLVELGVTDGVNTTFDRNTVTVELDQIYSIMDLMFPLKGVCYSPGFRLAGVVKALTVVTTTTIATETVTSRTPFQTETIMVTQTGETTTQTLAGAFGTAMVPLVGVVLCVHP